MMFAALFVAIGCSKSDSPDPNATLTVLTNIVPAPVKPKDVPAKPDWASIERELGTALPADYKALVRTFGTGAFAEFFWILNPFSSNQSLAAAVA